jgi:predicted metalloendopeptidase
MDKSASPIADFYRFANGGWLDSTVIPADKPAIDAFTEVSIRNEATLKRIVERLADLQTEDANSEEAKIGRFYRIGMDEARAEEAGIKPLLPLLKQIDAITNPSELMKVFAVHHRCGIPSGFTAAVMPDFKDSKHKMFILAQGGLGLPDKDYYLKDDLQFKALRTAFANHVQRTLEIAGDTAEAATARARAVLEIETELARGCRSSVEMRDVAALYNKTQIG